MGEGCAPSPGFGASVLTRCGLRERLCAGVGAGVDGSGAGDGDRRLEGDGEGDCEAEDGDGEDSGADEDGVVDEVMAIEELEKLEVVMVIDELDMLEDVILADSIVPVEGLRTYEVSISNAMMSGYTYLDEMGDTVDVFMATELSESKQADMGSARFSFPEPSSLGGSSSGYVQGLSECAGSPLARL